MRKRTKQVIGTLGVMGVLAFILGVWVLLHPASLIVQPWRAQVVAAPVSGVLFGPYPVKADFVKLRQRGVRTIISLLDPRIPYEKILLEQEQTLARQYGMTVENFPMGSILGQKFGDDYSKNAVAAAEAALHAHGVAYVHCYLGLHRAKTVEDYLAAHAGGITVQSFAGARGASNAERTREWQALEQYRAGQYQASLTTIAAITAPGERVLRLKGWGLYHLQQIPAARAAFRHALQLAPGNFDARVGLAYCDLQQGQLSAAEAAFNALLREQPNDVMSLDGIGNVYYRGSRWKAAEAAFAKAVALAPDDQDARDGLIKARQFLAE
ncbi:MAG TPA: tetratricopeptide repeat protein [Rhodanobacteraceae bacterium]